MTIPGLIKDVFSRSATPATEGGAGAPVQAPGLDSAAAARLAYLFRHCPPGSAGGVLMQRLARYRARGAQ